MRLYEIQPESCRMPLPPKELEGDEFYLRLLTLDPAPIYEKIADRINPLKRHHNHRDFHMGHIVPPQKNGICDCGCGKRLEGKRRRWATDDCATLGYWITSILKSDIGKIKPLLNVYYFGKENAEGCTRCGTIDIPPRLVNHCYYSGVEVDHIIPVHLGGGACWLSNYQLLCHDCHKQKTKEDRSRLPNSRYEQ